MSKNGSSLFNYWKSVPARDTQLSMTAAAAATKPPPPSQTVTIGSQPSIPICLDSSSSTSSPVEIIPPPLPPPRRTSRFKSPSPDPLSSDDSFPPSPVRNWHVASPPPPVVAPINQPGNSTTVASSSQSRNTEDVIRDSDSDDGDEYDSDDVESLQAAVRSSQLPLSLSSFSSGRSSTPPQTKRPRTNTLLVSPLPLRRAKQARVSKQPNPPRHKFDMQALLRHAEQDDAAEAAARRVSVAFTGRPAGDQTNGKEVKIKEEKGLPSGTGKAAETTTSGAFPTAMLDSIMDLGGEEDTVMGAEDGNALASLNKERLRRALDRTEVAAVSQQWYFFKEHLTTSPAKTRRPFPRKAARDHWSFLQDSNMQNEMFTCGVVRFALDALVAVTPPGQTWLPDELFLWILDTTIESPPSLRSEYMAILARCPEQVRRFVDPERLQLLFEKVSPRWESIDLSARLELVPAVRRPYPDRDWTPLRSLLSLLALLAETSLGLETIRCATKILLRLAMDSVVEENVELLDAYQNAMRQLVLRVPSEDWDDYCHDVCSSLYDSVQKPSLRWQVLACLPADMPACHELRRRLASAFLLGDPARARQDPRHLAVGGQGLAKLAARDDFVVTADTHYDDLVALINLLDVYVDDAGRQTVLEAKAGTAVQFDADVDELAARLQALGRSIEATSGGHVSRLESKTALDRVQIRLTHAVRTRRRGRRDIFGAGGSGGSSGFIDEGAPKQQDIRSFFLQKLAKKKENRLTERCASVS